MTKGSRHAPLTPSNKGEGGRHSPSISRSIGQSPGCSLKQYARSKRLPVKFLKALGLTEISYLGAPAVRMPYRDLDGKEKAVRFRTALKKKKDGDKRFRWRKGSRPFPYGLWRLDAAQETVVLVEGESDCHVLWFHGINAIGLPGAACWTEGRDAKNFEKIGTVYVVLEPDQGGKAVEMWLAKSSLRDRVRLVRLEGCSDAADLHVAAPAAFIGRWQDALDASVTWADYEATILGGERRRAWAKCQKLAQHPHILDRFAEDIRRVGVMGEKRMTQILYLALTSRLLERPVSVAVKGPSSGGKSFILDKVLSFFPPSAYYALTAMSDRALAYSDEPLKHRFLVIFEVVGMESEIASYLVRSLLSEGMLKYEFVEKTRDGLKARMIEREGPTGLLVTTTKTGLHPENETRLLSITVSDTQDQTRHILLALADDDAVKVDLEPWHALQEWIGRSETRVSIPFATVLAGAVPPVAVRLRRDFKAILSLIRAHAILHQASRERDSNGRIVATIEDYAVVRDLVADLVAEGIEATVPQAVRETVEAVAALAGADEGVTKKAVAKYLKIDPAAAWRRCEVALCQGYLHNLEERSRRPARLVIGEPLPEEFSILPEPTVLEAPESVPGKSPVNPEPSDFIDVAEGDCPIDVENEEDLTPSPPSDDQREKVVL